MRQTRRATLLAIAIFLIAATCSYLVTGCSSPSGPGSGSTMVHMSASFSKAGTGGFLKLGGLSDIDSLRIDSAVVVISRIKFVAREDSEMSDNDGDDHDGDDGDDGDGGHDGDAITNGDEHDGDDDSSVVFKGPFVIHVHDTVAIDFADKVLPAGSYDAIILKIRRLGFRERHWDSDEHSSRECWSDTGLAGASITMYGAVFKDSAWMPFTYKLNDNLEFKIKGNFDVPASTSSVNIALNFNMDAWFRNLSDGSLLDPTDTSYENRTMIRHAIEKAFNQCRGGRDRGGDGHPDD